MNNCWFCYQNAGESAYHSKCARDFFGSDEAPVLELNGASLKQLAETTVNNRISVTGVQPKLSVTVESVNQKNRLTIVGLWGDYILKPQHQGYSQMPETEDLTMHLASLFHIPVCKHVLVRATDGNMAYLAKRFDRENGQKVHQEDLCQLSEFPTANKYKGSYEKVGKLIARHCTNTGLDTLNYFELVLFSYLCGNNDMHLKNFSVVYTETGVALSPAYDLLNINLVNPKDTEEMALTLNGKKNRITLADFIALATTLKIPEKAYENSFEKFSSKNNEVVALINSSFLDVAAKEAYVGIWERKQGVFGVG